MKWIKSYTEPKRPVLGMRRKRLAFALWPMTDEQGVTIFLEQYHRIQEWSTWRSRIPDTYIVVDVEGWITVEVEHICSFPSNTTHPNRQCICGKEGLLQTRGTHPWARA